MPPQLQIQTDEKKLWENALTEIELNVSKANFNTWFRDTSIIKKESGEAYLNVPNAFVKEWLSNKYHSFIFKILRELSSDIRSLGYVVAKSDSKKKTPAMNTTREKLFPNRELPLTDLYINKEDNLNPKYSFESFVVGPFNELAFA